MENNKIKNTIVLRGMASNIVDEAIVILKPHIKIKKTQALRNIKENNKSKDLIIKEAEHIVEEYVNRIPLEELKKEKNTLMKKLRKLKIVCFSFFVLLIVTLFIK